MKEEYSRFRGAKIIKVILIDVNEGTGEGDDPIYRERYIVDLDGNFLAKTSKYPLRKFADDKFED